MEHLKKRKPKIKPYKESLIKFAKGSSKKLR